MHIDSKGWYVEQLKKQDVRYIEGRKIEKYKKHILRSRLEQE
ncbi:DUF2639 domain-containing protein [Alkalihalobacillus sp. CinArs1]|nr:DUF2639 domain-containing protein [Alkalihalobacillus sp. CinArs1]